MYIAYATDPSQVPHKEAVLSVWVSRVDAKPNLPVDTVRGPVAVDTSLDGPRHHVSLVTCRA